MASTNCGHNSLGIGTAGIHHCLFSLVREEIPEWHLNTLRTAGPTYPCIQFYDQLQRIRQNRIYLLFITCSRSSMFSSSSQTTSFSLTLFGTDPKLPEHEFWHRHFWLRDNLDVFGWYRKCPCICVSLNYNTDVGTILSPSSKMIAHLHRLTNTEKEKYSSQLFLAPKSISLLQIYIYLQRLSELAKKGGVSRGCIMNTEKNVSISTLDHILLSWQHDVKCFLKEKDCNVNE